MDYELVYERELDVAKDLPVVNSFSDGVYSRSLFMPKGSIIVGKKHKTRHLNMIMSGSARVWMDGEIRDVKAPDIIESHAGCRKVLIVVEDMWWTTVHVTDETNVDKIEEDIISNEPVEGIENIIKELQWHGQ